MCAACRKTRHVRVKRSPYRGRVEVKHPTILAVEGEPSPVRDRVIHQTQSWLQGRMPSEIPQPTRGEETLLAQWFRERYVPEKIRRAEEYSAKMHDLVKVGRSDA